MREYGKVAPQFWTGETGKAIRAAGLEARTVAMYLLTGPSATMLGLYYIALPTLAHESGLSIQGACKALRSLAAIGFSSYDEATEHVYVPCMARFQIGDELRPGDKRILGVVRELLALKNHRFVAEFVARYREAFSLETCGLWARLPLSTRSPLEAPSKPLVSQEQEQEQKQEQDQEKEHTPRAREESDADSFAQFWSQYPRKEGKAAALKAWEKLHPDPPLFVTMRAALAAQKTLPRWHEEGGRYVPHPATWLNGHRWQDEITPTTGATHGRSNIRTAGSEDRDKWDRERAQDATRRAQAAGGG